MDELQKLYDVLSRDGYYTKSFEEFQAQYEDPAYRDKVFGVITRDGLYTNSREEFDVKYSPLKKKKVFQILCNSRIYWIHYTEQRENLSTWI